MIKEDSRLSAAAIRKAWHSAQRAHQVALEDDVSRETEAPESELAFPRELMAAAQISGELEPESYERMEQYAQQILTANSRMNLVSRRDPAAQILVNILDALPLACLWPPLADQVSRETGQPPAFLLDAGSGSGVPGIPAWLYIAASMPSGKAPHLFLLESRDAKARFLTRLVEDLGMTSVKVFHGRLEASELEPWIASHCGDCKGILCARALASIDRTLIWSKKIRNRLHGALLIKGSPGLNREWTLERSRWPKRGWTEGAVYSFRNAEREIHHLWMRPV